MLVLLQVLFTIAVLILAIANLVGGDIHMILVMSIWTAVCFVFAFIIFITLSEV